MRKAAGRLFPLCDVEMEWPSRRTSLYNVDVDDDRITLKVVLWNPHFCR